MDTRSSKSSSVQLPGPRKKQAEALAQNIRWMVETHGAETVGFITLTPGFLVSGIFRKVTERIEASRRMNSLLTNVVRRRYKCGVVVQERHKSGSIHYHLIVATGKDIRGTIDFEAAFRRDSPDYRTANDAIREEWAFWRETEARYGFGRTQTQPIKSNGEAVGRYVGKYVSKTWEARRPEDKGARLVRYFGVWGGAKSPPWSSRHSTMTPRAMAWRDAMKQIQLASTLLGEPVTPGNIAEQHGPRWAYRMTRRMQHTIFFVRNRDGAYDGRLREGMTESNAEVETKFSDAGYMRAVRPKHIGDSVAGQWSHDYAKECGEKEDLARSTIEDVRFRRECSRQADKEWHLWQAAIEWGHERAT